MFILEAPKKAQNVIRRKRRDEEWEIKIVKIALQNLLIATGSPFMGERRKGGHHCCVKG